MSLLDRIKELREKNGNISINKLEKEAGLTRGSMSKWDNHAPSYDKLKKVADYFNVPVEYLLTGEGQKEKPTLPEEGEPFKGYSDLTDEEKEKVKEFAAFLLASRHKQ